MDCGGDVPTQKGPGGPGADPELRKNAGLY